MNLPEFPVEGGCQCRAVRYRIKARPLGVYRCYCRDCQRASGATHTISMPTRREDFEVVCGEVTSYDRAADSGRVVRMNGCALCGTKMWNDPLADAAIVVVKSGTLDDQGNLTMDPAPPGPLEVSLATFGKIEERTVLGTIEPAAGERTASFTLTLRSPPR